MLETIAILAIGWVIVGYFDKLEHQLYIIEKTITDKEDKNLDPNHWSNYGDD